MASAALSGAHLATGNGLKNNFHIALDAVAVIVHKESVIGTAGDISIDELFNIYTGQTTAWEGLTGEILPVSREYSSGTREAFETIVRGTFGSNESNLRDLKISYGNETVDGGQAIDLETEQYTSTSQIVTAVAANRNAIGYVSLGSVPADGSVKVLKVEGVTPSETTVLDATYLIQRPFAIFTGNTELTPAVLDFMRYLSSTEAQAVVKAEKFVQQLTNKITYKHK